MSTGILKFFCVTYSLGNCPKFIVWDSYLQATIVDIQRIPKILRYYKQLIIYGRIIAGYYNALEKKFPVCARVSK